MTTAQQIALKLAERIADHQVANFLLRGMNNTGRTAKSFQAEILKTNGNNATAVVTALEHVIFLDKGVAANRIPYSPGSGKKSSKFISGLIDYFKSKGLSDKAAKSAAFGTAKAALKRGMPKDKKKLGFLTLNPTQLKDVDNYATQLSDGFIAELGQTQI